MNTFFLRMLATDKPFFVGQCESLIVPTLDGKYGIMARHSDTIAAIIPGELSYRRPGEPTQYAAVSAGLVKIERNNVLVLVGTIERPEEIDSNRARRAADEAKEALLQHQSRNEYRITQASLARAMSRLKVKDHSGNPNLDVR